MKKFCFTAFLFITALLNCYAQTQLKDEEKPTLAAKNISAHLPLKPGSKIILVNSANKTRLAGYLKKEFQSLNVSVNQFRPDFTSDSLEILSSLIQENYENHFFIFLIDHVDAQFLFQCVGRPDMGLKIPDNKLFCDWLIPEDQFIRLASINMEENVAYQNKLRNALNTRDTIFITSKAGTNLKFIARNWVVDKGEIFCTPIENETNGVIIIDGCAYWGVPRKQVKLVIHNGKVNNINSLSETDKQEKLLKNDLTVDENASVLAEVGIGTNKNARWDSDIMESEQARGTCHFGFGMNLNYGGQIMSNNHFDVVILNPTIKINDTYIYEDGIMK